MVKNDATEQQKWALIRREVKSLECFGCGILLDSNAIFVVGNQGLSFEDAVVAELVPCTEQRKRANVANHD